MTIFQLATLIFGALVASAISRFPAASSSVAFQVFLWITSLLCTAAIVESAGSINNRAISLRQSIGLLDRQYDSLLLTSLQRKLAAGCGVMTLLVAGFLARDAQPAVRLGAVVFVGGKFSAVCLVAGTRVERRVRMAASQRDIEQE